MTTGLQGSPRDTNTIDTLSNLRLLLDGSLNTATCEMCGGLATVEEPVWVNLECHGMDALFRIALSYVELEYFPPEILAEPDDARMRGFSVWVRYNKTPKSMLIFRLSDTLLKKWPKNGRIDYY